jgi:NADH-quinone oxidoreductase subunit N
MLPNLVIMQPELYVLSMACFVLVLSLFLEKQNEWVLYPLSLATLIGAALLTSNLFQYRPVELFNGGFVLDHLSNLLKTFIYCTTFFVFLYSRRYVVERHIPVGEYYALTLFSVLGMMVLVSAHHLISLYLGLELMSLPLYTLVALQRTNAKSGLQGTEAAMKYFVMGAIASGMLLYGMSMIYGSVHVLDMSDIMQTIGETQLSEQLILTFGLIFVVIGFVFKLGGVPFHMWVPDVYHGAPSSVTLFLASASKIAVFGMGARLLIDMFPQFSFEWQHMLIFIAVLSMGLGNFVAIVQTNIKRMLGYSSIAHIGYMLLGFLTASPGGYAAATFYMITYTLMSLGAFGLVVILSRSGVEAENIDDFRGLNSRNPWLAFMMLLIMFSMAGVPPIIGFFAKVSVLEALVHADLVWLAVTAVVFSIVGAFYYLRVVKVMYFDQPHDATLIQLDQFDAKMAISINGLAILLLGLFPAALFEFCKAAFIH